MRVLFFLLALRSPQIGIPTAVHMTTSSKGRGFEEAMQHYARMVYTRGQLLGCQLNFTLTSSAIFHFGFRLGPANGHETGLELVTGAGFKCFLHHLSSLTRWSGIRGKVLSETVPKQPTLQSRSHFGSNNCH